MKKSIYLAALAALTLTACSNDETSIFEQSAAERLENFKKDYTDLLVKNGGIWEVEYFANPDEPGYVFVMQFDKNGSVEISANHKWIGHEFRQERSLWKMIADNGPVLSFNSYNTLFHIFSDPANITGADAPTNDDGQNKTDVDETGFGHEGDYEFQVMEVFDDGNSIRLMGKKYLYYMYMHRLDANTDVKGYMDELKEIENNLFSEKINNLVLQHSNGMRFIVNDAYKGVMSVYPEAGDPVDQTRKGNFIITHDGIRFMNPFTIVTADNREITLKEFNFTGHYSLADADDSNSVISAGSPEDIMYLKQKTWRVDLTGFEGSLNDTMKAFVEELKTLYNYKSAKINDFLVEYDTTVDSYVVKLVLKISSKNTETDTFKVAFKNDGGKVKIALGGAVDTNSGLALNAYTQLQSLFNLVQSEGFDFVTSSDSAPVKVTFSNASGTFKMNVL